jgi:mono/diheme cytochrome c family protein
MNNIHKLINGRALLKAALFCLSFLFLQLFLYSQEKSLDGEKIFKANCAACHSVGTNKLVGPGLQGINEKYSREWLGKWIINSGELIASGDADAQAIFAEYNSLPMPPQPVSEADVDAILTYIQNPSTGEVVDLDSADNVVAEVDDSTMSYVLGLVVLLLLILAYVLINLKITTRKAIAKDEGRIYDGPNSIIADIKDLASKNQRLIAVLVIILIFAGLVDMMDGAFQLGVHQGYKPVQPIKFSHKVHSGDNKIDCNYCHSSARHSKASGIPSLGVCLNCHKVVDGSSGKTFKYNGKKYPMTDEINKIYKYLDYDKNNQVFGDNPVPIKWIKVHNLPEHVFFSHEQHVTAGKQKCQTCHGKVEEMDVLEQKETLTMKWCVECHQNTAVATMDNGYYDDLHNRMTTEYKDKVLADGKLTVDEIGGWECAKCHY